jgi:hypothetical protein
MSRFDFSETKRQWTEIRRGAIRTWLEGMDEKFSGKFGRFFAPIFAKLPKNEAARWIILSLVSVSSTFMILHFIDSFMEEQDKYQTALTSVGRNRGEYNALGGSVGGTTTGESAI